MKITFTNCRRINPDRDGLDLQYFYKVDMSPELHVIHVVLRLGAQISWHMSADQLVNYSKSAFPRIVDFVTDHWLHYNELPAENKEYWEGKDFALVSSEALEWMNYSIELPGRTEGIF
ncbi:hypothetical protein [Dyadobacter sp. CY343]|uniref:hypothetical protein n=1 Tax=Dyadobacter sp. CY343 TaxID=2907299 RepID=UPI001F33E7C8|nr:hypothetical protein [Dyadobacter sp. CY343]MCE7062554.1 hypothetical protein [Dyadobacter sp. CY343]